MLLGLVLHCGEWLVLNDFERSNRVDDENARDDRELLKWRIVGEFGAKRTDENYIVMGEFGRCNVLLREDFSPNHSL